MGERKFEGKSRISSCIGSSFMARFVVDPYCKEGRRDGILDQDEVLVLLTLQSTPSGLLLAPNASIPHPNLVWLSVDGRGRAMPSPDFVEPWRGEVGLSIPSMEVNQGSFLVPNMLKVRLRVTTCLGLLDDSTG